MRDHKVEPTVHYNLEIKPLWKSNIRGQGHTAHSARSYAML